jgi:hypothetical protein
LERIIRDRGNNIYFFLGNVNQVDRARKEKPCLHDILNVIEKRDLLLLELEIERRR